jgi:GGDEF domain-containing protein
MSPERLRSGGASADDDVYAMALTLWEMWTCKVPEPGYRPRAKAMRAQIMFDVPSGLSIDEIKQVHRGMSEDPSMRPQARHMRFFNPSQLTTTPQQIPRPRLDPGPPPGRAQTQTFTPEAQSLLVTYATNAPEAVGQLLALTKPTISVGRRGDQDMVVPEATVSGNHANLRWQSGSWIIEDQGSTNGSYADHNCELRVKLVSFAPESAHHKRARQFLAKHDGLTGLLVREHFLRGVDEEAAFGEWGEVPFQVARYELRGPNRQVSERPTILEMLALRKAAQRVVELTETYMLSLTPLVAGRTGPLKFCVSMVGPTVDEARQIVEQVVSQVQGTLPESLELGATIVKGEAGRPGRTLID